MKCIPAPSTWAPWVAAAALLASGASSGAAAANGLTIFGSLGNFDVVNDTGQPTNGFEIELEGVKPGEVIYTFGDTGGPNPTRYIRYGKPVVVPNATATGTIVRYASRYDSVAKRFADATPAALLPYPVTMGHQCWYFGDPANYPTSGCEHFGMALLVNPTRTSYRWLVGNAATGTLSVVGSPGNPSIPAPVKVPPPVWNVKQPPPPAPGAPPAPPQVFAVVQAPAAPAIPPGGRGRWGDAIWMKIYKTELSEAVDLEDLLLGQRGVPDPEVEPPEIEWQLLQSPPLGKAGAWEKSERGGEPGNGAESVTRRYEYYAYTGHYDTDPENLGEALCDNPLEVSQRPRCGSPDADGIAGVGAYLGAQNAAANLVPLCAADVTSQVKITRSGYALNFTTRLYSQRITLTNTGNATLFGPLSIAFDGLSLSGNDGVYNLSGKTACTAPLGSAYINAERITSETGLAPAASVSLLVQFSNANLVGIRYTPRVLSTAGSR
jgi:hypothetical protein